MTGSNLKIVQRPIASLIPYARNSRTHTDAQVAQLAASIREFGWTNPVLIDGNNGIVAGHARVLAGRKLGVSNIPCIELKDLSQAQLRAYVIADNKLAENAGWDFEILEAEFEELIEEGFELDFTGFERDERQKVHKQAQKKKNDAQHGQEGEDDFGTIPLNPITRPGDVWHMGPHRLMCADSLEPETLAVLIGSDQVHLMATDPPYAIYGSATGMASDISDDKMVRPFFERILSIAKERLPWFGHLYMCCDWRSWASIWESAKRVPTIEPKNLIVWDKGGAGLGSNYANTFELIGFFSKLPNQTAMGARPSGQRPIHKPNVMRHNRPTGQDREHNAAKPVALFRDLIFNSSGPGDVVLEPFCGSGTTIIAADQADRICIACDIDPKWCDVTVGRFMRLRETPVTLGEDGPTFQEVAQQRAGDPQPKAAQQKKKTVGKKAGSGDDKDDDKQVH